ncbi:hypothetical protein [Meiothermus phage MMP17]|nr:hypothetical protein [Meiothermus phage MMP17]
MAESFAPSGPNTYASAWLAGLAGAKVAGGGGYRPNLCASQPDPLSPNPNYHLAGSRHSAPLSSATSRATDDHRAVQRPVDPAAPGHTAVSGAATPGSARCASPAGASANTRALQPSRSSSTPTGSGALDARGGAGAAPVGAGPRSGRGSARRGGHRVAGQPGHGAAAGRRQLGAGGLGQAGHGARAVI